jgi:K319-like protein
MGLQLSVLLSFSIILLLSIIYSSSSSAVNAQLTNSSSVVIPMTSSVNTVQIKQQHEQQSNNNNSSSSPSSPLVFSSPNIRNPLPIVSTSSFSGNYPNFQVSPVANAGHNQTVTAGSTVILNGSNSKSPNGIILGYSWKQIPTSSINLGAVNSPVWDFTAPRVITNTLLQFQLNVTDNWGQTGTSFVNVLDKPAMAIHTLSSSLPQVKSQATVTKTVTSNNQNKAQNYLVNIPTNYNTQKLPSPQKQQQQQLQQQPPLIPPISSPR